MITAALNSLVAMNRRKKNKRGGELMKNNVDTMESCAIFVVIIETFLSMTRRIIYRISVQMCCL